MTINGKFLCILILALLALLALTLGVRQHFFPTFHNRLEEPEKRIGTHDPLSRSFHVAVEDPQGAGFRFPGVLVGVEKADREKISVPSLVEDPYLSPCPGTVAASSGGTEMNRVKKLRKELTQLLDDGRRTFISHAIEYRLTLNPIPLIDAHFIYDAYGMDSRRGSAPLFVPDSEHQTAHYLNSWRTVKYLKCLLRERILGANRSYTHLIFGVLGWNTSQVDAIRNLNNLFANIMLAARDENSGQSRTFHPLFIGMTWHSHWHVPAISYFNKANDADEIGFTWANAIINNVLCALRDEQSEDKSTLKVIAIGHSFGARIVTRAVFGGEALKPSRRFEDGVDLVIGLQGAFSMNRFLAERRSGLEGHPYSAYPRLRGRVALTWSNADKANPIANFVTNANHAGGKPGFERAKAYCNHFHFLKARCDGTIEIPCLPDDKRILMIDASKLVRYQVHGKGGYAHNDIYNRDMGRLIWALLSQLASVTL